MTDSTDGQLELIPTVSASSVPVSAQLAPVPEVTTQTILANFLDWHTNQFGVRVPKRQIGRLAKEIKGCLDEDYPQDSIKWGLCSWTSYLIDDPTKNPPVLSTIVYSLLMRSSGHSEHMRRARHAAGLPDSRGARRSSESLVASNTSFVDRLYSETA